MRSGSFPVITKLCRPCPYHLISPDLSAPWVLMLSVVCNSITSPKSFDDKGFGEWRRQRDRRLQKCFSSGVADSELYAVSTSHSPSLLSLPILFFLLFFFFSELY